MKIARNLLATFITHWTRIVLLGRSPESKREDVESPQSPDAYDNESCCRQQWFLSRNADITWASLYELIRAPTATTSKKWVSDSRRTYHLFAVVRMPKSLRLWFQVVAGSWRGMMLMKKCLQRLRKSYKVLISVLCSAACYISSSRQSWKNQCVHRLKLRNHWICLHQCVHREEEGHEPKKYREYIQLTICWCQKDSQKCSSFGKWICSKFNFMLKQKSLQKEICETGQGKTWPSSTYDGYRQNIRQCPR